MNILELTNAIKCYVLDTTSKNVVQKKRLIATDENATAFLDVQDISREGLLYFDCIYRDGQVRIRQLENSTARKAVNAQIGETTYNKLAMMAAADKRSMTSMIEWLIEEKYRQTYGE